MHRADRRQRITVAWVEDPESPATPASPSSGSGVALRCVGRAGDVESAVALVARRRPQVILYDPQLGGRFRPDGIARIREVHPTGVVIVVTARDEDAMILEALRHGADGYVLREDRAMPVARAVEMALHGEVTLSRVVTRRLLTMLRIGIQPQGEWRDSTGRPLQLGTHELRPDEETKTGGASRRLRAKQSASARYAVWNGVRLGGGRTLTARQWRIFELVTNGCGTEEIAAVLGIRPGSVRRSMISIRIRLAGDQGGDGSAGTGGKATP